jgi:hypothetical protein
VEVEKEGNLTEIPFCFFNEKVRQNPAFYGIILKERDEEVM